MGRSMGSKDLRAGTYALAFLVLGFLVIAMLKNELNMQDNAVIVTLLVTPLLVYALVSGRLTELSGPGGWGAKFHETATDTVDLSLTPVDLSNAEMQIIPKGGAQDLQRRIGQIKDAKPIVMTMTMGRGYYNFDATLQTVRALSQFRNFKFVAFCDQTNRLIAYIPSWVLKSSLEASASMEGGNSLGREHIEAVNSGDRDTMLSFPGIITETVSARSTNAEALAKMEKLDLEALIAVNERNEMAGVVERDRILSRMLLALAKGAKAM